MAQATASSKTGRLTFQVPLFILLRLLLNTGYRMVYPYLPVFGTALGVPLSTLAALVSARSLLSVAAPLTAQWPSVGAIAGG